MTTLYCYCSCLSNIVYLVS